MKKLLFIAALSLGLWVGSHANAQRPGEGPNDDLVMYGMAILPQADRLLDTRVDGVPLNGRIEIQNAPYWSTAVVVNVTVTNTVRAGYATLYDCVHLPDTSNVNWQGGDTVANLAIVPLSADGALCVQTSDDVDLVVDLQAWTRMADRFVLP